MQSYTLDQDHWTEGYRIEPGELPRLRAGSAVLVVEREGPDCHAATIAALVSGLAEDPVRHTR